MGGQHGGQTHPSPDPIRPHRRGVEGDQNRDQWSRTQGRRHQRRLPGHDQTDRRRRPTPERQRDHRDQPGPDDHRRGNLATDPAGLIGRIGQLGEQRQVQADRDGRDQESGDGGSPAHRPKDFGKTRPASRLSPTGRFDRSRRSATRAGPVATVKVSGMAAGGLSSPRVGVATVGRRRLRFANPLNRSAPRSRSAPRLPLTLSSSAWRSRRPGPARRRPRESRSAGRG